MERIGKSEARARFLRLVERVASGEDVVEITDRGEVAAVLMGYREYQSLLARGASAPASRRSPVGTVEILADLEAASEELAASLRESLQRRAEQL